MSVSLTTNAKEVFGQAARVLVGDPTVAAGAGLIDFGNIQRVGISLEFGRQAISNEGGQFLLDGAYGWVKAARLALRMFSAEAAKLAAIMPEVEATGNALKFRTSVAALEPPSLIVVPESEYGSAATSDYVWFVPGVVMIDNPGEWVFKLEESQASGEPFDVTLMAALRMKDQADADLEDGQRIIFRGDKPTGWSFPSGY